MNGALQSGDVLNPDITAIKSNPSINHILEVVCRSTGMRLAAVARVTKEKWVAYATRDDIPMGLLPGRELRVDDTICSELDAYESAVMIEDADREENPRWCHKMGKLGFKSYIAVPIRYRDGSFFGSLCALDFKPVPLNRPEMTQMFRLFAELISFHLEAHERVLESERLLKAERRIARRRDQFIAILGHDLRNPLSAILSSSQLLERTGLDERGGRLVKNIRDASFRIKGLIDNILDFAKGQLGSGLSLKKEMINDTGLLITQVLKEVKIIWPERPLKLSCPPNIRLFGDPICLSQVFSNLISNAVLHGDGLAPITISAVEEADQFLFSVTNRGKRIPRHLIKYLFEPFSKGEHRTESQGLGLGLFIVHEIAKGHGGKLSVISDDKQTTFTFSMPVILTG